MFSIIACLLFLKGPIVIVAEELSSEYLSVVQVAAANIVTKNNEQLLEFDVRSCDDAHVYVYDNNNGYDFVIKQNVVSEISACHPLCEVVDQPMVDEAFCWTYASFWVKFSIIEKILEFGKGCEKDKSVLATLTTWEDFRISDVHVAAQTKGDWKFGDSSTCYNSSKFTLDNSSATTDAPVTATTETLATTGLPQQSPANGSSQAVTPQATKRQGSSASAPGATALSVLSALVAKMRLYM